MVRGVGGYEYSFCAMPPTLPLRHDCQLTIVSYWRAKLQEPQWRDPVRMGARPPDDTSRGAEPERVFSAAEITLCRVGDDAIEAVECLESWRRHGLWRLQGSTSRVCEEDPMGRLFYNSRAFLGSPAAIFNISTTLPIPTAFRWRRLSMRSCPCYY